MRVSGTPAEEDKDVKSKKKKMGERYAPQLVPKLRAALSSVVEKLKGK